MCNGHLTLWSTGAYQGRRKRHGIETHDDRGVVVYVVVRFDLSAGLCNQHGCNVFGCSRKAGITWNESDRGGRPWGFRWGHVAAAHGCHRAGGRITGTRQGLPATEARPQGRTAAVRGSGVCESRPGSCGLRTSPSVVRQAEDRGRPSADLPCMDCQATARTPRCSTPHRARLRVGTRADCHRCLTVLPWRSTFGHLRLDPRLPARSLPPHPTNATTTTFARAPPRAFSERSNAPNRNSRLVRSTDCNSADRFARRIQFESDDATLEFVRMECYGPSDVTVWLHHPPRP
ncbi:MAG: hypothetical protein QOJ95_4053 [Mycobacterium sp.]|nr:hypothetical protein [Mycobacterium sp.]